LPGEEEYLSTTTYEDKKTEKIQCLPDTYGVDGPFGKWGRDENGLPCFDLAIDEKRTPYSNLHHLIATGRLSAFCDRWGNVALFTTDGGDGYQTITRNMHQSRSACYCMIRSQDEQLVSLLPGELPRERSVRYGVGYAVYRGIIDYGATQIGLEQIITTPSDAVPYIRVSFRIKNIGNHDMAGGWVIATDCSIVDRYHLDDFGQFTSGKGEAILNNVKENVGDMYIVGPNDWEGKRFSQVAIGLEHPIQLKPGQTMEIDVCVGYGDEKVRSSARTGLETISIQQVHSDWKKLLLPVASISNVPWERDECIWTLSQLLAFRC